MDKKEIKKERDFFIAEIKKYSPLIRPFFELEKSLADYSKGIYDFKHNGKYIERQKMVKEKILTKFKKLFGESCQEELRIVFDEQLALNIVDHHMVLNHPMLISTGVVANVEKFIKKEKQTAIIVISSGDVPPNNYFSKNGLMLHNKKVPLFSNSEKELSSYFLPKRQFDFIERLKQQKRWSEFNKDEQDFLVSEDKRISALDFSRCKNYLDQISLLIKESWPLLFEKKLRESLPELLYITQEELTRECLIDLLKEDNYITHTLLNKDFREKVLVNFRGIVVTWREQEGKGTHFFWRRHPTRNSSLRLYLQGDKLVPYDDRYKELSVKLERNELIELMKAGEIYPSLFMIFSVLNFYCGVKPLVGQGSLVYLNLIRDAWLKTLRDSDWQMEIENIKSYNIDKLIAGTYLFFSRKGKKFASLFARDIMYEGGVKESYLKMLFKKRFCDIISVSATGIYDYVSQKYIPPERHVKPKTTPDDFAELVYE